MLLQKTFITDHITKRKCVNRGELPMYYIENSHEAIIIPARSKRNYPAQTAPTKYQSTGIIRCSCCEGYSRRKHASAGSKYEKVVWICANGRASRQGGGTYECNKINHSNSSEN